MAKPKVNFKYPLRDALDGVGVRPAFDAARPDKKNYAEKLSRALAVLMARALRPHFPKIIPTEEDIGHETAFGADQGKKRLDVAVWHERDGLILDVSIKTYSFQDYDSKKKKAGRYTKNLVRNDHELRAEADKIHRRQPYAVLVGLMFMPFSACMDGRTDKSSFAHAVVTFRKRTGRGGPDDRRYDVFEAFYIGLYEFDGKEVGYTRFFDVSTNPPRQGKPKVKDTLSLKELVEEIKALVDQRNSDELEWAEPAAD